MLISLSLIMFSGLVFGYICRKIHFPSLFGMIIAGIIIGPYVLNLIDKSILDVSSDIRRIALIVILIRAGLKLNIEDLKKAGRPAILMCFVPACFEILGMIILTPYLLGIAMIDAAIMGAVVGAVSPAVIVPRMIKLIDEKYGNDKGIAQMILAGASVDDVFVIVIFTSFAGIAQGEEISVLNIINVPITICIGVFCGLLIGVFLSILYKRKEISDTVIIMILLGTSFLLSAFENSHNNIPFSSLIAIMSIGMTIRKKI